jgi:hypothetical protein
VEQVVLVASFLVYFTVLLASIAAQRLAPRATIAAFLLGPILLTPYWLAQDYDFTSWFTWAKLYTICAAVLFLNGARAWQRIRAWGPCNAMVLAILLVNILEAVLFDLARGFLLNALVGALILGSAWWGYGATAVRLEGPRRDLLWSTSRLWIVAYTTWNITFVIGAFPTASLMHCAVLGSALAVGMYKPGHWYMARVVTLAVHAVVAMTHPLVLEPMRVPLTAADATVPTIVALALAVAAGAWAVHRRRSSTM